MGAQTFATSLATQLGAGATNAATATAAIGAAIAPASVQGARYPAVELAMLGL